MKRNVNCFLDDMLVHGRVTPNHNPLPSFTPSHPYQCLMHVVNGTVKLTRLFQEHSPGSNPELESSVGTNRPPHVRQASTWKS